MIAKQHCSKQHLGACGRVDRALDSRSNGLDNDSHCWLCVESQANFSCHAISVHLAAMHTGGTKKVHFNDSLLLQKMRWFLQRGDENVKTNIPILGVQLYSLLNSQGCKCTFTCDVHVTVCVLVSWHFDTYLICLCNLTLKM